MNPVVTLVTYIIGFVYLIIRYRTLKKARQIRDKEYHRSFSTCGLLLFLNVIAGSGAIFFTIMVIIMIIGVVYKLITKGPSSFE